MNDLKTYILIVFLLSNFHLFAQRNGNPCDRKLYTFTDSPSEEEISVIDMDFDEFLVKYINKHALSRDTVHIIPQKEALQPFNKIFCLPEFSGFTFFNKNSKQLIQAKITYKNVIYKLEKDSFDLFVFDENHTEIISIRNQSYWGSVHYNSLEKQTEVEEIESIVMILGEDTLNIAPSFFQDLKNPNTCLKYFSEQPIEVYYSPSQESFYVYIYGRSFDKSDEVGEDYESNLSSSYLAKIIIDKNKVVSRIVIPSSYLGYYGWKACLDFWVF